MVSGMEPEEMVNLTSNAVQEMINQHQQLPGSVKRVKIKNQFIEFILVVLGSALKYFLEYGSPP